MRDVIVISSKQVKELRQDGIVYLDDAGNEQFIDFETCYQRYLAWQLHPEHLEAMKIRSQMTDDALDEYVQRLKNPRWKYIANRNVLGNQDIKGSFIDKGAPYFEFYSAPAIRIEFATQDELWQMREKLEHTFKWRTNDLS